jgi:large subunit ribosomal protein L21e
MPKSHGPKRKSRHILTKNNASRGLSYLLVNYSTGNKVVIDIDPREHKTMPHRRFQGKVGIVREVGRRTIKVGINVGNKQKIIQARFNHVKPIVDREEKA